MKKRKEIIYECSICKFKYKTKSLAKKCHDWCRKYKSCNINITKYAVK
ncbi:hypothetical protein HYX17_05455 [Candidatus Woesearchaeota archaeon]|nr:hypothetical protein [Candidatus Woesearchaeota archaeon]